MIKKILFTSVALLAVTSYAVSPLYPPAASNFILGTDGGAPQAANNIPVLAYKSAINFGTGTAATGQDVFTVPTGQSFVCTGAWLVTDTVTGAASGALTYKIIESGGGAAMTQATANQAQNPAVGKVFTSGMLAGNAPFNVCAAGNKVQVSVTVANTSTTATGTVYVTGFYR